MIRWLVCMAVLAGTAAPARAGECERYMKILTGVAAPCDGVGMSGPEYARFLKLENELAASQLKLQVMEEQAARDARTCQQEVDNQRDGRLACERDKSPRREKVGLLESPTFWGITGVVLGVAVTVLVVHAVK